MAEQQVIHMALQRHGGELSWSLESVCGNQTEGDLLALDESSVDCEECHRIMEENR